MVASRIARWVGIVACILGILFILFGGIKTPQNFRILSDLIQNFLLINLIILIFQPSDDQMKVAIVIGIFTMVFDFILETAAVELDWWYPLGGTQFPPFLNIPLEIVLSFMLIGAATAILLYFPEVVRNSRVVVLRPFKFLFKNPKWDNLWRVIYLFLNAFVGTNGDYSAGPGIWAPGPTWHPAYTFIVWFAGGLITLGMFNIFDFKFVQKKKIAIFSKLSTNDK